MSRTTATGQGMSSRILFLVMSAVQGEALVGQLAAALAPSRVLVHHDFSQDPGFRLELPNVSLVPDPVPTGWSDWGFSRGVFHAIRHALDTFDFDYLKLLSPSCLPIRPVHEFEAYVASSGVEANFEALDMWTNSDALMSAGYRALATSESFAYRALFRIGQTYFGPRPPTREVAGVQLFEGPRRDGHGVQAWLAHRLVLALAARTRRREPFASGFPLRFGATWFGARRPVLGRMLEALELPGVRDYFSRLWGADEFLVPSILAHVTSRPGPLLHLINAYDGARPNVFVDEDFETLRRSGAFFARKFPEDVEAPLRLRVLAELAGCADPPVVRRRA